MPTALPTNLSKKLPRNIPAPASPTTTDPSERYAWGLISCAFVALATAAWVSISATPIGLIGFVIGNYGVW